MKRFAYVTEKGIMHVVKERKTAEQYSANGKVVESEIEVENGYPVVKGKQVIVYGIKAHSCYFSYFSVGYPLPFRKLF